MRRGRLAGGEFQGEKGFGGFVDGGDEFAV